MLSCSRPRRPVPGSVPGAGRWWWGCRPTHRGTRRTGYGASAHSGARRATACSGPGGTGSAHRAVGVWTRPDDGQQSVRVLGRTHPVVTVASRTTASLQVHERCGFCRGRSARGCRLHVRNVVRSRPPAEDRQEGWRKRCGPMGTARGTPSRRQPSVRRPPEPRVRTAPHRLGYRPPGSRSR